MIKKFTPLILSLTSLFIITFFWDYIKLPYDFKNNILGEHYVKQYNPSNDIIRFIIFIGIPVFIYLYFFLRNNKNALSVRINNKNFFIKKLSKSKETNLLNKYSYFMMFLIFVEFLSVDFNYYISHIDLFHSGSFLVPPMNFLISKNIFQSTIHDYGFIANNLGLIYNYFFGYFSLGSIFFIFLFCIFLVKFFLILIAKKITNFLPFDSKLKVIFFFIFC